MTEPLTPPDCDLRDFPFMPIDIGRLFGSQFHALSDDAAWRAGVSLWLKSYHQVPGASLPDDDVALTRLAELGRDTKTWKKIKSSALRGWVKCNDGRLYHATVAEKALEGWIQKLTQRKSSAAGNAKRYGSAFDPTSFDEAIHQAVDLLIRLKPDSKLLAKRPQRPPVTHPGGTENQSSNAPTGRNEAPTRSDNLSDGTPDELPSRSQETGNTFSLRSKDAKAIVPPDRRVRAGLKQSFPVGAFELWYQGYPHKVGRAAAERAFEQIRKADTTAFEQLIEGRDRYVRTKPIDRPWCNPATWLNQGRWADEPATSQSASTQNGSSIGLEPRVDLGGGIIAPHSTIRSVWSKGRWPGDWGPAPNQPGCRIPPDTMSKIMNEEAA